MADSQLDIIIKMQDEASSKIKELSGHVDNLGNTVSRTGPSFITMASAVAVGQAAFAGLKWAANEIVGGLKDVIQQAAESEAIMTQTNAVIASTKGVSGMTADSITKLATSLSTIVPVDDEVIQSTENMLLTFTNIHKDIFPKVTETALDMSQALGQDTKASAIQLGKALQDPVVGVTALQRVGVKLTDAQKDQVKHFMAVNDIASAQGVILQELQTEFGGSARAAGQTFGGQMKILNTQIDNVKETIGTTIITAIQPFIQKLTAWAGTEDAQNKIKAITEAIGRLVETMMRWITEVAIPWVQNHWPQIKQAIVIVGDVLKAMGVTIQIVYMIIKPIIEAIVWLFRQFGNVVFEVAYGVFVAVDWIKGAWGSLVDSARGISNAIKSAFSGIWVDIKNSFKGGVNDAIKIINRGISASNSAMHTNISQIPLLAKGTNYFQGGLAIVGEQGPELVNLPQGSQVIPNNRMGQTINVNIYGNISTQNGQSDIENLSQSIGRMINRAQAGI